MTTKEIYEMMLTDLLKLITCKDKKELIISPAISRFGKLNTEKKREIIRRFMLNKKLGLKKNIFDYFNYIHYPLLQANENRKKTVDFSESIIIFDIYSDMITNIEKILFYESLKNIITLQSRFGVFYTRYPCSVNTPNGLKEYSRKDIVVYKETSEKIDMRLVFEELKCSGIEPKKIFIISDKKMKYIFTKESLEPFYNGQVSANINLIFWNTDIKFKTIEIRYISKNFTIFKGYSKEIIEKIV